MFRNLAIRISGGYLRGRRITSPTSGQGIRPTTEKVKLAMFSIIGPKGVSGKKALDLFACSGALGLEAISRGAESAHFVEKSGKNYRLIQENIDKLGIGNSCMVTRADCVKFISECEDDYGLVMLDPPFEIDYWQILMINVGKEGFVSPSGIVVAEHKKGVVLEERYGEMSRFNLKTYGDSQVSFYEVVGG